MNIAERFLGLQLKLHKMVTNARAYCVGSAGAKWSNGLNWEVFIAVKQWTLN